MREKKEQNEETEQCYQRVEEVVHLIFMNLEQFLSLNR